MTDKKTTRPEQQTEKKRSVELKDEQLDEVQGGAGARKTGAAATNGGTQAQAAFGRLANVVDFKGDMPD